MSGVSQDQMEDRQKDPEMSTPAGWVKVPLTAVTDRPKNINPNDDPDSKFGYVDISAIDNTTHTISDPKRIVGKDAPSRARRPIKPGDVLFSNVRTYLRNVAIVPEDLEAHVCSTGFTVLRSNGVVDPRYLFRYVLSQSFIDAVTPQQTGSNYPATNDRVVRSMVIPLPPLPEQRRIVKAVESLFSELRVVRDLLNAARHKAEQLRKAVLRSAVYGSLTEDWRASAGSSTTTGADLAKEIVDHRRSIEGPKFKPVERSESSPLPELPADWAWVALGNLVRVATGATPKRDRADYYGGNTPWVTSGAVNEGLIMSSDEFITDLALKETNAKIFPAGSLLVAMYGEGQTRGRVAELGIDAATNQAVAALIFDAETSVVREYIRLFMQENYEAARRMAFGGVQPNLSLTVVRKLMVPLPPIDELHEIVSRSKVLLGLLDEIENRLESASVSTSQSEDSVLEQAFKGELVATEDELARAEDRTYEIAADLLERLST